MTAAGIQLACFDEFPTRAVDPQLAAANRAALAKIDPQLAAALQDVTVPADWLAVTALDGTPTFLVPNADGPARPRCGTAIPHRRTAAVMADFEQRDRSIALPGVGTGAELAWLLQSWPAHLAVFVFPESLPYLAALLTLHDFSAAIAAQHCILIQPEREAEHLRTLLERVAGLRSPGTIILADLIAPERLATVQTACETVGRAVGAARRTRMAEIKANLAAPTACVADGAVYVLALRPAAADQAIADELATAGAAADHASPIVAWGMDRPAHADPLALYEAWDQQPPRALITINHGAERLPAAPQCKVVPWITDSRVVGLLPAEGVPLIFAATPQIVDALAQRCAAGTQIELLPLAACAAACTAADTWRAPDADGPRDVLLIGDLPNDAPEAAGVRQSTHKRLWQQIQTQLATVQRFPGANELLARAEQATHIRLDDTELRRTMLALLEQVMLPAKQLAQWATTLTESGYRVHTAGAGWDRYDAAAITTWRGDADGHIRVPPACTPVACVLGTARHPLRPAVLDAAARGWPLVLYADAAEGFTRDLAGVLSQEAHFARFRDTEELTQALQFLRDQPEPARARAQRACTTVRTRHTYAVRLQHLLSGADISS